MFCKKAYSWYVQTHAKEEFGADVLANYAELKKKYKQLCAKEANHDAMSQIERDLGRTFPRNPYFMKEMGGNGHEKLRRVLTAFSVYESEVCYVQGMNFIVA